MENAVFWLVESNHPPPPPWWNHLCREETPKVKYSQLPYSRNPYLSWGIWWLGQINCWQKVVRNNNNKQQQQTKHKTTKNRFNFEGHISPFFLFWVFWGYVYITRGAPFLPSLAEHPKPQLSPWFQGLYPSRPRDRLLAVRGMDDQ